MKQTISWRVRRQGNEWQGEIVLPVGLKGCTTLTATAKTKSEALSRAASIAKVTLANPVLQAALPPQAQALLKGVQLLSKAKVLGKLKSLSKKLNPRGRLKKLAKAFW